MQSNIYQVIEICLDYIHIGIDFGILHFFKILLMNSLPPSNSPLSGGEPKTSPLTRGD
jgi:hypothetical protein